MGDAKKDDLRVGFDSRLKLKFCGSQVTSDAGLLAYCELDEALGLTEMGADLLTDSRLGSNKQHLLVPLLRQSIYSRLAGYEDVNDAERLAVDPAMRHVGGRSSSGGGQRSRFHERRGSLRDRDTQPAPQPDGADSGHWICKLFRLADTVDFCLDVPCLLLLNSCCEYGRNWCFPCHPG